jgi:tetratricopeptide (TPR) repeat protein
MPVMSSGMRAAACAGMLALSAAGSGCAGYALEARPENIPALEQAAARSPGDATAATQLGAAYYAAGRLDDARATLQRVVDGGRPDGTAYLYLGLTYEGLEDWSAARAAYQRFMQADGSSRVRGQIRGRLAIVAQRELRQLAREALHQESLLSDQPATPNSVAVMPFRLSGLGEELQPLQTALADMIITDLSFTSVRSVERVRVQSMIDEMVLTQAGITTAETGARMGRLLRAEHVVQGLITATDADLALAATVLNTARRGSAGELSHRGRIETIFDLQKQAVFGILDALGIVPTAQEREAITGNRTANLVAFIAYGRGLEALDRGDYSGALNHFREAAILDPGFRAASVQQSNAQELTAAPPAEQIGVAAAAEIGAPPAASLAQQILNEVNPSPASALTTAGDDAGAGSTAVTATQTSNPGTEMDPKPSLVRATTARIIITIPRPGGSQ